MKKKLLIVTPHFYPEHFRINELAEKFTEVYDVTVWSNIPNYPKGRYFEGYGIFRKRKEIINGVRVSRIFELPRLKGKVFLALNYLSFMFFGIMKAWTNQEKFDVVMTYGLSPVYSVIPANIVAKKQRIKHYLYVLDLWPSSFKTVTGISDKNWLYRKVLKHSRRIYSKATVIGGTSKLFEEYLVNLGINFETEYEYVPNHAEDVFNNEIIEFKRYKEHGDKTKILFAGNIGEAQNLRSLIDISRILKEREVTDIVFQIVGDGSYKGQMIKDINAFNLNMYFDFYGRLDVKYMPYFYEKADILFLSLVDSEDIRRTLPGKVQGYIASKKPILAIISGESEMVLNEYGNSLVVNKLGESTLEKLYNFIDKIKSESIEYDPGFYEKNYTLEIISKKHIDILMRLTEKSDEIV